MPARTGQDFLRGLKDDERYQYARNDRHRFASWSMAKTVTAMLVGIAIAERRIHSVDDPAAAYVSALAGTEYGRTPLRHLLQMSSGVRFDEHYSGRDDLTRLLRETIDQVGPGGVDAVKPYNERVRPSGTVFSYASAETQVLGLVLRSAIRRPIADYLQEKVWGPIGAEADATWLIDRDLVTQGFALEAGPGRWRCRCGLDPSRGKLAAAPRHYASDQRSRRRGQSPYGAFMIAALYAHVTPRKESVVNFNALAPSLPHAYAPVPRPSRPQPRTPPPRWSRRHSIRVNCVCPGFVETDMWATVSAELGALSGVPAAEFTRRRLASVPLGRMERPEDVANVIGFLASSKAAYMTGQAISVDGGLVMH